MTETVDIKKAILQKLMFVEYTSYGDLEKITTNHDLFNYHLKELQKSEFVEKTEKGYALTAKGRHFVSLMEEDGSMQRQFKVGMFIDLVRKIDGKYQMLLHRRLKHPHYGYSGAVTGKLKWGESLESNVKRELMEELRIEISDFSVIGVSREIFHNEQGEVSGDGVFFVVVVQNWTGGLCQKNEEGEYYWHDIDKILELDKIFKKSFERGIPLLKAYLEGKENGQFVVENGTDRLRY